MKRRQVGVVDALWRYPVKSMRGEALDEAVVTERGTLGDRVWALREMKHGGIMSARTFAAMLRLRAAYESDPIRETSCRATWRSCAPRGSIIKLTLGSSHRLELRAGFASAIRSCSRSRAPGVTYRSAAIGDYTGQEFFGL